MPSELKNLIAVARGELPADLILANARIINVFNSEIEEGSVAVCGGMIAGIGDYKQTKKMIDVGGRYIAPGLINTEMIASRLQDPKSREAILEKIPLGRLGEPRDIALLVRFLASEASDYLTGQIFTIDGGAAGRGPGV